jgi:hypothetical protein
MCYQFDADPNGHYWLAESAQLLVVNKNVTREIITPIIDGLVPFAEFDPRDVEVQDTKCTIKQGKLVFYIFPEGDPRFGIRITNSAEPEELPDLIDNIMDLIENHRQA